ncbi:MAG: MMPL family transporter [Gammaproteobacteria bacterium]|nr:MAG: MMPL family transporter [Gammaproteobacteria bacterium]
MSDSGFIGALERLIFGQRKIVIGLFVLITLFMAYTAATQLRIDTAFSKQLPTGHEYMQTFREFYDDFGGANRVLVALVAKDGDMFDPEFFETLKAATDAVFFIPGVDRPRVQSIFTPNVRYLEVVEDGIEAGNVIDADFAPTPEGLAKVRENILKANIVGRLIANNFSGAIISAQLLEVNPETGEPLNYFEVARLLDEQVRYPLQTDEIGIHIIGFAKVVGDIKDGATRVGIFFIVTILITAILVYIYSQSIKLTIVPLICSLLAVIWQLGMLPLLRFGIDPMGLLVPFLVFAIGVSHGVQMVSSFRAEIFKEGVTTEMAARTSFRRLAVPGFIALASDTIGFVTILLIDVPIIREMAIAASVGVASIILTNLVLLPLLLCHMHMDDGFHDRIVARAKQLDPMWKGLSAVSVRGVAAVIIGISVVLYAFGAWKGADVKIGDLHAGVPELRPDSRYNVDTSIITENFSIGVDLISVIAWTEADGCIDYNKVDAIDRFAWNMRNVEGVQDVIALPQILKVVNAGWNEGFPKWRVLSRDPQVLVQSGARIETSTGLLNRVCSAMPVMMFTADHKAETIDRVVAEVKRYREANPTEGVEFRLATGNVGVMAAQNEEVSASQFPILIGVFSAVILMCWLTFRSFRAVLCIVLPLGLVSVLAYALMTFLQIGLKVNTLPVVALGVGVGVDYGIYIYSRFKEYLERGEPIQNAYEHALRTTGSAVIFTGITLGIGVFTWIFSPLQLQADMGILLTFMFIVNMLGAILVLPALASWILPAKYHESRK